MLSEEKNEKSDIIQKYDDLQTSYAQKVEEY
jgi:hypothetical protein